MSLDQSVGLCKKAVVVNLAADTDLTSESVIYVGTGGNVKVDCATQGTVTFKNVPAGTVLPWLVKKVYSTTNGTTAADLIAGS